VSWRTRSFFLSVGAAMRHILPHVSDVLVLCYHALSPDWPAALSTTPERFERQVAGLLRRGYAPATFAEAVGSPPAKRTFAVTFDDAYTSVLDLARPILDRLGAPATVFVATDYPDRPPPMAWPGTDRWLGGPHEHELRCMSWDQLRALAGAGWEIGSHSCSHPYLTELEDDALARELADSRTACERAIGGPCASIAYPYGDVDARVAAAAQAAGYRYGAALSERIPHPAPLHWPRTGIYNVDAGWRARLKFSPLVRRALKLRGSELSASDRSTVPSPEPSAADAAGSGAAAPSSGSGRSGPSG
jgi:peptidoglycan/xylan/chitin deacetylase (PgdA/CDA1 family)